MAGGITDKAMAGEDIVALIEATEPKSGNIVEPVDAPSLTSLFPAAE
jgi:hypothetical protein